MKARNRAVLKILALTQQTVLKKILNDDKYYIKLLEQLIAQVRKLAST